MAERCPWCRVPKGWHSDEGLAQCAQLAATRCTWCTAPLAEHDAAEFAECRAHLAESDGDPDDEREELARATAADEALDAAREDNRDRLWL